jgi:mRNA-degrading endonuclease RelE of RelBE toxin-antitoxin system
MILHYPDPLTVYSSVIGNEVVIFGSLNTQWSRIQSEISLGLDANNIDQKFQDCSIKLEPLMSRAARRVLPSPAPSVLSSAPIANELKDRRPPPWYVAFTSQFRKDISGLDTRLMGRVLEKISEITVEPCRAVGDTIKPLVGVKKGFWRIRIGDHRLVYFPDSKLGNISIHAFAPRGSVYE